MERVPNGRYTKEFREEAVKMVTESGMSVLEVSRRLSLPMGLFIIRIEAASIVPWSMLHYLIASG